MSARLELLFLSKGQVDELGGGDMEVVYEDIRETLSLYQKGECQTPHKIAMRKNDDLKEESITGRINAMPGHVGGRINMSGIKWIGSAPSNHAIGFPRATALIVLNDPVTKIPLCVMDGTQVSAMRTGAVSGLAIEYLSKKDAKVATMVGAGVQGRTQLRAMMVARPELETVYMYDISMAASEKFKAEMEAMLDVKVIPVGREEVAKACKESDIIITCSMGTEPLIEPEWMKPGCLGVCIAANEFFKSAVELCDKVTADSWDVIAHRLPELINDSFPKRIVEKNAVDAELGEIINGVKPGRENDEERIFFRSAGMGIEDIAVATRVYHKAKAGGIGTVLTYWED